MAITATTPVSGSTVAHGDSFSFTIDNTYTTLQIKVQTETVLAKAYDTALGGAQAGYTVSVTPVGGTDVFTVARDAGWDKSPQLIYVEEDESGATVVTNISYALVTEEDYPQGTHPYNAIGGSDPDYLPYSWLPLNGVGAPGVSTGNGKQVGHVYIDTAADEHYVLADGTIGSNVWDSGGGGVSDHGALTGLADDDHPQYLLTTGETREYHVGTDLPYATIDAALTQMLLDFTPSATDKGVVVVHPGRYVMTTTIVLPAYVGVTGSNRGGVRLYNATTDMFQCTGVNWLRDMSCDGAANSSLWLIDGNDASTIVLENFNLYNNGGTATQGFLNQTGTTWTILSIRDCLIDHYGTSNPNGIIHLENTGALRFVDTWINGLFCDNFQFTTPSDLIQMTNLLDIRFRYCTLRGNSNGTGLSVNTSGADVVVRHCGILNGPGLSGFTPISSAAGTAVYTGPHNVMGELACSFGGTVSRSGSVGYDDVFMKERADHKNVPTASYGEYWVRDDAPCVPVFTDDAGTDHLLLASGGFTDAPDGALFTERADHVNTPAPGFGEIWVRNDDPPVPMFTDDAGDDLYMTSHTMKLYAYYSALNENLWRSWSVNYGPDELTWSTSSGSTASDPALNYVANSPVVSKKQTLRKVTVWTRCNTTCDIEYEIWKIACTDGMSSTPSGTLVASGTDSLTATNKHKLELTIADADFAVDDMWQIYARRASGTGSVTNRATFDFEWTE